jgi:hypothetical protein
MGNRRTLIFALFTLLIATVWPQLALAKHPTTTIDAPGAGTAAGQGTFLIQNLNSGTIVGYYFDTNFVIHGFIRSAQGEYTIIDVPGAAGTAAYGINEKGTTVGWWFDTSFAVHGYVRDDDGNFTTFDVPGAGTGQFQGTYPLAINVSGTVSGQYTDGKGMNHGFARSPDGTITSFDPVGSTGALVDFPGITRAGAISGLYSDANNVNHGYVRDPEGAITSFDAPGAGTASGSGTFAAMITDAGTIPGAALDNNYVFHGCSAAVWRPAHRRHRGSSACPPRTEWYQ